MFIAPQGMWPAHAPAAPFILIYSAAIAGIGLPWINGQAAAIALTML